MLFRDRWILFLATGCGTGKIPLAPGTFGSLFGLLVAWCVAGWQRLWWMCFIVVFCALAVGIAHRAEKLLGAKDPGSIVIDEIAGILVACAGLTLTAPSAAITFIVFRLFDIFKPFPVGWLDRHLDGGIGIVADDVAAGILTNMVMHAGYWLISVQG